MDCRMRVITTPCHEDTVFDSSEAFRTDVAGDFILLRHFDA